MAKWKNGRLYLGALGTLEISDLGDGWAWQMVSPCGNDALVGERYPSAAAARRAAESWLRRALKQADKRIGG
jgi:TfoX/Sxy family transcriptional regulator of competence genes